MLILLHQKILKSHLITIILGCLLDFGPEIPGFQDLEALNTVRVADDLTLRILEKFDEILKNGKLH